MNIQTQQPQQLVSKPAESIPLPNPLVPGTDEAVRQVALLGYN